MHTLDTAQAALKGWSTGFRTASSAKPNVCPASGPAVGRRCRPCERAIGMRMTFGVSRHYPGIRAGGICDQTKKILPIKATAPDFRRESERNIVSRERPEHKGAGIVIR
jgi:hypothetical protein